MRDVPERAAVDERRSALDRLNQVRLDRILQNRRHRALDLEITRGDRSARFIEADDDSSQPLPEIHEIGGEAQGCHDLGRSGDIEA